MTSLEKSVLSVIVYFDIFDYPVTLMEVWQWLYKCKAGLSEVEMGLERLKAEGLVVSPPAGEAGHEGFYFLAGRKELVETRMRRYNIAERKYKRALRVGKILSFLPHVRMIGVCNTLGYSNARDESDIDLFIVAKTDRIWSCRFFVLMVLKLLGLRPKEGDTRDKICASFFVTSDNLNLEKIKIEADIYLHYWLGQVVPIYDKDVFEKFREENKLGDYDIEVVGRRRLLNCQIVKLLKSFSERLFLDIDEKFYRWLQMKIMPKRLKEIARCGGTDVIINDKMLKFHENDRRKFYRDEFYKRFSEMT